MTLAATMPSFGPEPATASPTLVMCLLNRVPYKTAATWFIARAHQRGASSS
jgi:hypothetical protein